jgi:hypothetical protein
MVTASDLLFVLAIGILVGIPGWAAWTGRWRRWAHPRSGWGAVPILLFWTGTAAVVCCLSFLILLPYEKKKTPIYLDPVWVVAILSFGVTLLGFYSLSFGGGRKRPPQWAIPRWLPQDWEVPLRAKKVVISSRFRFAGNPLDTSSFDLGDENPGGSSLLGRAVAFYLDPDNPDPYLEFIPGARAGRLRLFNDGLVFAQAKGEDAVRREPFVLTLKKQELKDLAVRAPGRQGYLGFRIYLESQRCRDRPRLGAGTAKGRYEFIVADGDKSQRFAEQVVETLKPSSVKP